VKRHELLIHTFFLLVLCIIVFLPLYRQTKLAPEGTYFPLVHGRFSDYYSYISYIRQGAIQLEQTNQYSTEDTTPKWTHFFYLLLGKIGSLFNISPFVMYHLGILVSLLIFYFYTYSLVKLVLPGIYRLIGLFIIFFAGPLPIISSSAVWWTKMDQYNRNSLVPHHYISSALLVASTYYLFRFTNEKKLKYAIFCVLANTVGIFFFIIPGFIFTLALLLMTSFMVISSSFRKNYIFLKSTLSGLTFVLVASFVAQWLVLQIFSISRPFWYDPLVWEYETHKSEIFPTIFSVYVLSYGILFLFIPFSAVSLKKIKRLQYLFIILVTILPLFLYQASVTGLVEINKLRFVYSAPYVFGGLLATLGIKNIRTSLKASKLTNFFAIGIGGIILVNSIMGFRIYWWPHLFNTKAYKNIYISTNYLSATNYLNSHAPKFAGVMTNWGSGSFIPAFSFVKVFIGHEFDTNNFWQKWDTADKFYKGVMTKDEALTLLKNHNIAFVLWDYGSPVENYKDFLTEVYAVPGLTLYKVKKES